MDRIMVVDDEKKIIHMITEFMKVNQIEVIPAYSGSEAIKKLDNTLKLIILDINMDDIDGIEVCKRIREKSKIPIIFLSANSSQYNKVLGFGIGADDYVTKPFDPIELVARVKAHIRRHNNYDNPAKNRNIIRFGRIKIDRAARRVMKDDKEIAMSTTEFNLLLFFIDNSNTVLSRKQILQNVWKSELYDNNTVTTYVKRLRDKLEEDGIHPKHIKSVRGIGYIFEVDIESS